MANNGDEIEVWGDGKQTRSFLYIDECIEGTVKLLRANKFRGPVNIGSDQMISINNLAQMVIEISHKNIVKNIPGPEGVRGRNSDNKLILSELGWKPTQIQEDGIAKTYRWIEQQVMSNG